MSSLEAGVERPGRFACFSVHVMLDTNALLTLIETDEKHFELGLFYFVQMHEWPSIFCLEPIHPSSTRCHS